MKSIKYLEFNSPAVYDYFMRKYAICSDYRKSKKVAGMSAARYRSVSDNLSLNLMLENGKPYALLVTCF